MLQGSCSDSLLELGFGFPGPGFLTCLMLAGLLLGCVSITALLCLPDWGTMGLRPADESTACTVAACVSPSFGLQLCFCWPWQVCSCLISVFMSSPLVNTELNTAGLMLFWPASNVHGFFSVMVMTLEPSEGWHLKCLWLWGVSWRAGLYGIYSWNFDERVWSLGKNWFTVQIHILFG